MKAFLTTGEAARLLNISRSTVARRFDAGMLAGKKNPITAERLIGRESLTAFMRQHGVPTAALANRKTRILLGTADEGLVSRVQELFRQNERFHLERVRSGCDVLVRCIQEQPDLLILDEELPDVPSAEVVKSLRRADERRRLKILYCTTRVNRRRWVELGADDALAKDAVERELATKLHSLLKIPEVRPVEPQEFGHQRRWPRIAVRLPARVLIYRVKAPRLRDHGTAVVENISRGGCYLSRIRLETGRLPGEPFRFLLEIQDPPLTNWRAHCRVVRLQSNGSLAAGLQFVRLSRSNRRMIEALSSG